MALWFMGHRGDMHLFFGILCGASMLQAAITHNHAMFSSGGFAMEAMICCSDPGLGDTATFVAWLCVPCARCTGNRACGLPECISIDSH